MNWKLNLIKNSLRGLIYLLFFISLFSPESNAQDVHIILEKESAPDSGKYEEKPVTFSDNSAIRPDSLVKYYIETARLYGDQGNYDTALLFINNAIRMDPSNYLARRERMIILMIMESYESSMKDAENILSVISDDLSAIYCLATGLMNTGDYEKSKDQIQKGIELAPKLSAFYTLMSKVLIQQRSYMEGEMFINRAIELEPQEIGNYFIKAENAILSQTDPSVLQENIYPPKFLSIRSPEILVLDKLLANRKHQYYYKTLSDKFIENFRSLSLDEYFMFYFGQTVSDRYTPYAQNERSVADSIYSLSNRGLYDEAAASGSDYLAENPSSISIYYHTGVAYLKSGKSEKAEEYFYKYQGLITSIIATGDGKSDESAYIVISSTDEYTIIQYFGYSVSQQVLQDQNGHYFDLLTVVTQSGEEKKIYFNIDKPFGTLSKQLR
jgi:tetratricopeptide (TPR) repeat protein